MWDEERRRHLRAELDALYGLNREELSYILDTLPIFERKDIQEFGDYGTKKLILHCFDKMQEAYGQKEPCEPILNLLAADLIDLRPAESTVAAAPA